MFDKSESTVCRNVVCLSFIEDPWVVLGCFVLFRRVVVSATFSVFIIYSKTMKYIFRVVETAYNYYSNNVGIELKIPY